MSNYPRTIRANRHNGVTNKATPHGGSRRGQAREEASPMQDQDTHFPLMWRKSPWSHPERAGQRCRSNGYGRFEFPDGEVICDDPQSATKPPRIKWYRKESQAMRARIAKRARYRCVQCGAHSGLDRTYQGDHMPAGFAIDHIYPFVKGGSNDEANLQLLCDPCNQRKWCKT